MPGGEFQLDHVVVLVPYADLLTPPAWITDHFTLSPGGRHADGKTENRLVLFADGSYLEFIAFIDDDPARREGHWWDKPFGLVDFALTTPDARFGELAAINARLSRTDAAVSYSTPQKGGRIKPDGTALEWRVTFPQFEADDGLQRGAVPFWCHDLTPRAWRVPITPANTRHPSGVVAMAGLRLAAAPALAPRLITAHAAILDHHHHQDGDGNGDERATFPLSSVHQVPNLPPPALTIETSTTAKLGMSPTWTLLLHTPDAAKLPPIQRDLGDGALSILFELP